MKQRITQKVVESAKPSKSPFEIRDTILTGFICRVQPSGRKSFIVEYGRGRRITIGNAAVLTPGQAREKAKSVLGQVADGLDPAAEKRKLKAGTLEQFIECEYRPWAKVHRKHGDVWCDQILRVFGSITEKHLTSITSHHIERIRTARLNSGISAATVNRNITTLRGALSYAVRAGYLEKNPLSEIKPLDVDQVGKTRYLTKDEASRLIRALKLRDDLLRERRDRGNAWRKSRNKKPLPAIPESGYGDRLTPLVLLSLHTGVRRGEAFALEWSDVDFDLGQITVRGVTSKRNRTRHIPLNATAQEALKQWRLQSGSTRLVFPGPGGSRLDNVRKSWAGVLTTAGIESFRWHDLRHTFASWLVMKSVDLNTVRALLGHSDLKMTLRYAHLAPEHKASAVAKLV